MFNFFFKLQILKWVAVTTLAVVAYIYGRYVMPFHMVYITGLLISQVAIFDFAWKFPDKVRKKVNIFIWVDSIYGVLHIILPTINIYYLHDPNLMIYHVIICGILHLVHLSELLYLYRHFELQPNLIVTDMVVLNLLEMNANISLLFPDNTDYFFLAVMVTQIYTLVSGTYGFQFKSGSMPTSPVSLGTKKDKDLNPLTNMCSSNSYDTSSESSLDSSLD